jgi:hypothetical protein
MLDRRRSRTTGRRPIPAREVCRVQGCGHVTTERKPYCIEHLDRLPYVRELQAQLCSRDAEEEAAASRKGWRAVDPGGSRAREIIDQLAVKGAQTPKRLAITVELQPTSLENYLGALERAGFIKTLTLGSRRGTPRRVVTLTDEGKTHAVNIEEPITEAGESAEAA